MFNEWWLSDMAIPSGFSGTLNVALPLFPDDGSLERAASGQDNDQWERMGRLIAEKYPTAYVRPGWEMNIVNWNWRATDDNVEEWKKEIHEITEWFEKFGEQLPAVLWTELDGLKARLGM